MQHDQSPKKRESVWDYPRPPAIQRCPQHVRVVLGDVVIADSSSSIRVLETSHPPTYYIPREDLRDGTLFPTERQTYCEFKGAARYFDVRIEGRVAKNAAWSYPQPTVSFKAIRDHVAFYPHLMDACYVDDELVQAQQGRFYGGWITSGIEGPFKGPPGTLGW